MVAVDLGEVAARQSSLHAAVAELADLPFDDLPADVLDSVLCSGESAQRTRSTVSHDAINRLHTDYPGRTRRLHDHLATLLRLSATEAAARIATAKDLAADQPAMPETAAAARHGLVGAEHLRIIRDTLAKLSDTATTAERARFDLELTGVAVAERPEVLRRDAALLLADYDATHGDPVTRQRSRRVSREFVLGPQDPDGMSRGQVLPRPRSPRLPGDPVRQTGPPRHGPRHRPRPHRRRRTRPRGRCWRHPHPPANASTTPSMRDARNGTARMASPRQCQFGQAKRDGPGRACFGQLCFLVMDKPDTQLGDCAFHAAGRNSRDRRSQQRRAARLGRAEVAGDHLA